MSLAFQLSQLGQSPRLITQTLQAPVKGEARVRIAACGLNHADLLMMEGRYQEKPALPFVPGLEAAGWVEKLGPETEGPPPGSRVAVFASRGGLAQAGNFPVAQLLPIPDEMTFEQAAGFQVAYGTSHLALAHRADLRAGETLLVTGAAGGVGLTAVEIGKLMKARVIAVARGADRLAVAKAAGADVLIDSEAPDLKGALRALGGVDVTYDTIGGHFFTAAMGASRPEGRLLAIGFAGGEVPQIPANHLLVKNLSVVGVYWGAYLKFRPDILTNGLRTLLDWYSAGRLHPHISHVLPLSQADQALALLKARMSTGKIVVRCDPSL